MGGDDVSASRREVPMAVASEPGKVLSHRGIGARIVSWSRAFRKARLTYVQYTALELLWFDLALNPNSSVATFCHLPSRYDQDVRSRYR